MGPWVIRAEAPGRGGWPLFGGWPHGAFSDSELGCQPPIAAPCAPAGCAHGGTQRAMCAVCQRASWISGSGHRVATGATSRCKRKLRSSPSDAPSGCMMMMPRAGLESRRVALFGGGVVHSLSGPLGSSWPVPACLGPALGARPDLSVPPARLRLGGTPRMLLLLSRQLHSSLSSSSIRTP